ncbi:MAG: transposase [Thermodesulfobacteriota bacterium]|nr:transposase [Thermodesulfobacteriota bacterium]
MAYDPAISVKIVLYAYSRGIVSSRKISQCCCENIMFIKGDVKGDVGSKAP